MTLQLVAEIDGLSVGPFTYGAAERRQAAEFARRYRRSHSDIGLGDYLIAATASVDSLELATLNVKHFPMFDGLEPPFPL